MFVKHKYQFRVQNGYFHACEPKAPVHYCEHGLPVGPSSLSFDIFAFSSETAEQNLRKFDRKQVLKTLYSPAYTSAKVANATHVHIIKSFGPLVSI